MPQVPIVEKNIQSRGLPTPNLRGYNGSAPQIEVPQNGLTNLSKAVMDIAMQAKERGDNVAVIEAQRKLDDWEATNLFDPRTGALAKKGRDTFNLPNTLVTQFDEDMNGVREGLANDDQKLQFDRMATARRGSIQQTLFGHERTQMDAYASEQSLASIKSASDRAALYYNSPEIVEESIKSAQEVALRYASVRGLSPDDESVKNDMRNIESATRLGVLSKTADKNTAMALEYYEKYAATFNAEDLAKAQGIINPVMRKHDATNTANAVLSSVMPKTSQSDMIDFVIHDLEGGDKVVPDGDGIAKYGVNSAANKDVDVENLDEKGARDIYMNKYWKEELNDLPVDVRLVAFDMYVNGWDEKVMGADVMGAVEKSGYDARKLIEMRAEYYDRLVRGNPDKHAQYAQGWTNRLGKLSRQLDAMRGELPNEYDMFNKVDELAQNADVAKDAKDIITGQIKAIKDARQSSYTAASEEAWQYVSGGLEVPASVEAKMSPKDVSDMRNTGEPDPELYEQLRNAIATGQPLGVDADGEPTYDLNQYRWRLRGKYDELAKLQNDPAERVNAATVDDVIKSATGLLLGKPNPKTRADYEKIDTFRRRVQEEIDVAAESSGKKRMSPEDVQRITDRMLMSVSAPDRGLWGKTVQLYEVDPAEERYSIEGIPADRVYIVGGQQYPYDRIINKLTSYLEGKGQTATPEAMRELLIKLQRSGQIEVKNAR